MSIILLLSIKSQLFKPKKISKKLQKITVIKIAKNLKNKVGGKRNECYKYY